MTISSITSGLGNQLFQYAAGLHWAQYHGGDLRLDPSWFLFQKYRPRRAFRLASFRIAEPRLSGPVTAAMLFMRAGGKTFPKLAHKILGSMLDAELISERDPHLPDSRFVKPARARRHFWLAGYWQTADHFLAVRTTLMKNLQLAVPPSPGFLQWLDKVKSHRSVFVHVRRGDYATLGHGMLTSTYYSSAAERFSRQTRWFIFSEDPAWCRKQLVLPGASEYVEYGSPNRDVEDLLLMAACQGGIIANSSFSWWGAALGDFPARRVVAPRFRHGPGEGDIQQHRLLPSWEQVESF